MSHDVNPKHWVLGFFLSFLIIYSISFFFGDTNNLQTWSPDTGTWIRTPGSVHKHRSEGWGTSRFGQLDVIGVDDVSKIEIPEIAIWGDSHVEAFQVEQRDRMEEVLNGMCRTDGMKNLKAFGVGNSGESVADWYFKIPRYEKKCLTIFAHFIVLSDISDCLPDQSSAKHATFLSKPEYRIIESVKEPGHQRIQDKGVLKRIKEVLNKFGLDFGWSPIKSLIKDTKLQFSLGPHDTVLKSSKVADESKPDKSFSFLLHALRQQTAKPIVFVYCPHIPVITGGEVSFKDHESDIVSVFAQECQRNGIVFIDMTQDFCNYYRETGAFPRGFPNSRPSEGHFNGGGHRMIAKAIYRAVSLSIDGRFDDFHAN